MMKTQLILKMKHVLVSEKLSTPIMYLLLFQHVSLFVAINLFNLESLGWPKIKQRYLLRNHKVMKSFSDIVPSRNNAFILVFQTRHLKTFLLYIIYQNNSVGCSQIGFSIGCDGTVSKREEILAGQSFPNMINLGQINLKTGYAWLL